MSSKKALLSGVSGPALERTQVHATAVLCSGLLFMIACFYIPGERLSCSVPQFSSSGQTHPSPMAFSSATTFGKGFRYHGRAPGRFSIGRGLPTRPQPAIRIVEGPGVTALSVRRSGRCPDSRSLPGGRPCLRRRIGGGASGRGGRKLRRPGRRGFGERLRFCSPFCRGG
jgi:hypothetical protein